MDSCMGAVILSNFSSWASWSDNPFIRGFVVKLIDKSIKILSIAVLEPFIILVGKFTVLFKLKLIECLIVVFYYDNVVINISIPNMINSIFLLCNKFNKETDFLRK